VRYDVYFKLLPAGSFGVPEDDRIVVPPGDVTGPAILTSSMVKVGHGTLSQFRQPEDAINEPIALGEITGRLDDNYLTLSAEAEDPQVARERAQAAADTFAKHLTLGVGRSLSATLLAVEDENGQRCPIPHYMEMFSVTHYGLDDLREHVRRAQAASSVSDITLNRAVDYFDHATFLTENAAEFAARGGPRHYDFFASTIFLNLWKAVTVIIGDSTEKDFQSRYKTFGITYDFFKNSIGRLKGFRDSYDVAHHHITPDRMEEVKQNFGEAAQIAREVVTRYRDHVDPPSAPAD
jgi:hypothetical protein